MAADCRRRTSEQSGLPQRHPRMHGVSHHQDHRSPGMGTRMRVYDAVRPTWEGCPRAIR